MVSFLLKNAAWRWYPTTQYTGFPVKKQEGTPENLSRQGRAAEATFS
jgi:hypothetical protein